ncbi:MAG: hypothetical protein ACRC1L_05675 [Prochlorococcaceae cyanobacterium]
MARTRFNGAIATVAALVGGGVGLSVALLLRSLIQNTPAQVQPTTFYWWIVLLTAFGALWGLATQTMKQLERIQGYRQGAMGKRLGSSGDPHRPESSKLSQDADRDGK